MYEENFAFSVDDEGLKSYVYQFVKTGLVGAGIGFWLGAINW